LRPFKNYTGYPMAKTAPKKIDLNRLDYLLSEGISLVRACDMAKVPLTLAMEHLKKQMVLKTYEPHTLNMVGSKALEAGLKGLIALSESMVPQVRLQACAELTKLALSAKKLYLDTEISKDAEKSSQKAASLWEFRDTAS